MDSFFLCSNASTFRVTNARRVIFADRMQIEPALPSLPDGDLVCTWQPHGERLFLFVKGGHGVLIRCTSGKYQLLSYLPHTFRSASGALHENSLCEAVLVNEEYMSLIWFP